MIYNIIPIPAPRMTRSDKWKKRPCVLRYFNFKDQVNDSGMIIYPNNTTIIFHLPMPRSWSRKKQEKMVTKPHVLKPDVDNLLKALLDALYKNDSAVWDIRIKKVWSYTGKIEVLHEMSNM